jgi:hypothetical protein
MIRPALCTFVTILIYGLAAAGCAPRTEGAGLSDPERRSRLQSIMPATIEIVAPMTQPASFDEDPIPDGLRLVLRVLDPVGEPLRMTGDLVFELYAFRGAAADPRGQQLQTWQYALATAEDQATRWNRATRMYEFPLLVDGDRVAQHKRFVVVARYTNPWGEHLEDRATIEVQAHLNELRRRMGG